MRLVVHFRGTTSKNGCRSAGDVTRDGCTVNDAVDAQRLCYISTRNEKSCILTSNLH